MPERSTSHEKVQYSKARRAAATGLLAISMLGALAERSPADAAKAHDKDAVAAPYDFDQKPLLARKKVSRLRETASQRATRRPTPEKEPEVIRFGPINEVEKARADALAAEVMRANTVLIRGLGCSGFLVRDETGTPIGVRTAEHCGLRAATTPRYLGSDGQNYIVRPPITVEIGDQIDQLQEIGQINSFLVPDANDMKLDGAYGVISGNGLTVEDVKKQDIAQSLPIDDLSWVNPGDPLYMSGWPIDQINNPGPSKRQAFKMTYLGYGEGSSTTTGEKFAVIQAAVDMSPDGAECSYRASGSGGFVLKRNAVKGGETTFTPLSVGPLSLFYDFRGVLYSTPEAAAVEKQRYQDYYGKEFITDNTVAVCSFAYEVPDIKDINTELKVVQSRIDIPGYSGELNASERYELARRNFFSDQYTRQVIDGVVHLPLAKGGGSAAGQWIDHPVLMYDPKYAEIMLAYYDPMDSQKLQFYYYNDLAQVELYDRDAQPGIGMLTSSGTLTEIGEPDGTMDGFQDPSGMHIIQTYNTPPAGVGQRYTLSYQNGSYVFQPA